MTDLPDVNVWLALVDENHVHHERALAYWCEQAAPEIAFCRITMLALLRLSTHPKVLSRPLRPDEAWSIYRGYRKDAGVGFIAETPEVDSRFMAMSTAVELPHHLWTDCYLAALATCLKCRIVSFDDDFKRFPDLYFLHLS